ncbi:low-temperature viability protein ltv1-related [Holotrichia oblita]|uniref:Low-temperature viability protein ltv1-related n=1 Tax=Holotrichia oblita TaxID=644536 RepID=A0ACB9TQ99_HOLOL|nr:low-temperature viability protein ltv1-related [Holotrichia oblita]
MPKKKKFIDRKNAVTFHLVHRSQQDPLVADENAPQRVLMPEKKVDKQIAEQHKYGIYFDDDYNYLQHLRETGPMEWEQVESKPKTDTKLNLPSSVFASNVEEDVGLLNKAAPQSGLRLDLDPEIVAAMDDDFDFSDPENQLEDNFIEIANAEGCGDESEDYSDESYEDDESNYDSEERDEVCSLEGPQYSFKDEETKSRFTEYSMSSSVMKRNEQLTLLDNRFEKLYASYDDNEIGALDCEEIEGYVHENSDILIQYAEEFEREQSRLKLDNHNDKVCQREYSDSESVEELVNMDMTEKEKWDCASILSTYSNIYNHPKLIEEPQKSKIKINMKTGMPMNVLNSNKLTAKALEGLNQQNILNNGPRSVCAESVISTLSTLSIRPKDESSAERKERKKMLREYRRERRLEKKANTHAFKEEAKRQAKIVINNRNNVQGNKIL